jgi:hypothetical protein
MQTLNNKSNGQHKAGKEQVAKGLSGEVNK